MGWRQRERANQVRQSRSQGTLVEAPAEEMKRAESALPRGEDREGQKEN